MEMLLFLITNLTQSFLTSLNDSVESTDRWSANPCFPAIDTTKTSSNENSFKIIILDLIENVVKFGFRKK